jgi:hypothetical protein
MSRRSLKARKRQAKKLGRSLGDVWVEPPVDFWKLKKSDTQRPFEFSVGISYAKPD